MDKISIITICYNCKADIEATLQSVIGQTYPAKEYIVVDGGSTDGTVDIVHKYEEHIDLIISEPDNGIYDALNKGIRKATGEWILCMNAGDVLTSNEVLSNIFAQAIPPNIDVIYSDYWIKLASGELLHCTADRAKGVLLHQSCVYRKHLHDIYGYYTVTHPYIISDLLFLLMVPVERYMKVHCDISINDGTGVSAQGLWALEGAECARAAYRLQSIHKAYFHYMRRRIITLFPYKFRHFFKKLLLKEHKY